MSTDSVFQGVETALKSLEVTGAVQKDSRVSYTRDFLLSLAELDVCRELPSGFNTATLSELDDACNQASRHQRSSDQEYNLSASATVGGILGNGPQSLSGRWGSHMLIVRDSSSNPNHYSDSGRLYCSHSSISQGTDHHLLKRSREPYRPPCFQKAVNYSGIGIIDASNGKTLFFAEMSCQERSEEERMKDSFELIKNGRDNQENATTNDQKENLDSDICVLLKTSVLQEIGILKKDVKSENYSSMSLSDDECLLAESTSDSRSFISLGITSEDRDKCCGVNNVTHSTASQIRNHLVGRVKEKLWRSKGNITEKHAGSCSQVNQLENIDVQSAHTMQETIVTALAPTADPTDIASLSCQDVVLPSVALDDNNIGSDTKVFSEINTEGMHNLDFSTSVVGRTFDGDSLSEARGLSRSNKFHDILVDGATISKDRISKFAHWSVDEESLTASAISSCGNNDRDFEKHHHLLHDWDTESTEVMNDIAIQNILALLQEENEKDFAVSEWTVHNRNILETSTVYDNVFQLENIPQMVGKHKVPFKVDNFDSTSLDHCSDHAKIRQSGTIAECRQDSSHAYKFTSSFQIPAGPNISLAAEEAGPPAEILLPDEDSLITVDDVIGCQHPLPIWTSSADCSVQTSVLLESTGHLSSQHASYGCDMGLCSSYPEWRQRFCPQLLEPQMNPRRSFPSSYSRTHIRPPERFGNLQSSPTFTSGCQTPVQFLAQSPGPPLVDLNVYGNYVPQVTFPRLLQTENSLPHVANTHHTDPRMSLYAIQMPNFAENHDLIHSLSLNEQRNSNVFANVATPGRSMMEREISSHWTGLLR